VNSFALDVFDIESPTRAHIHRAPAGQNGSIVVFCFDVVIAEPIPVAFEGCAEADRALLQELLIAPEGFYVNIHNDEFPGGAIRGQLAR